MKNNFKIKIFCNSPELCNLMKKVLNKNQYVYECIKINDLVMIYGINICTDVLKDNFDVLILDKDVESECREKITMSFPSTPIICLPSLESEKGLKVLKNIHHLSEPFKLSEFEEVLNSILNSIKEKNEI